jgi:hypothetical protein
MSGAAAFAAVAGLISLITDPKAAEARLDALQKAAAEIETAQAQLEASAFAEAKAELDLWSSGCCSGAELWRRLKEQGYRGSLRVITEWATRRRRSEKADAENLQRIPSARTIARFMTIGRHALSKAERVTIAAIENGVPLLVEIRLSLHTRALPTGKIWSAAAFPMSFHGLVRRLSTSVDAEGGRLSRWQREGLRDS